MPRGRPGKEALPPEQDLAERPSFIAEVREGGRRAADPSSRATGEAEEDELAGMRRGTEVEWRTRLYEGHRVGMMSQ